MGVFDFIFFNLRFL